ncbi:sigma-54-dependent Fis family transcriptional regulator [Janthinobacterium sp. FW305-128]|uniref:sigma-54 interaction domain-containing protein n=1 Tax=Janthinobacterium sp. FW305-128 TaxID=2775055 RepID=UPI0027D3423F|nr:sigma 54-interacting transcriptional regulator [Janthinobacterium sp. FW305-128]MCC7680404.1 sigma 54-interacting transcriptional regulator [Janthinobacterium sp. FW305-128]
MELLAHNFSSDFARSAHLARGASADDDGALVAFRDPQQMSLLVRATAFVFADPRSRQLHELIERIAPSEATVLITGETGTGKELIARHVHGLSGRAEQAFVAINCGAFSETLVESELFGYEKGAFTGAQQGKPGWFETASGGTLFLDEIGDLPLAMQVKLLRVLQEREVVRLGARRAIPIDVRLIAATNVDLAEAVRAGRFREDLYYRLQVIGLPLRPLRERPGDIMPLTRHFMALYAQRLHLGEVELDLDAQEALLSYPWPGNIRELENVIHRALLVCRSGVVRAEDLSLSGWHRAPAPASAPVPVPDAWAGGADIAYAAHGAAGQDDLLAAERFARAWQALLDSGEAVEFEAMQQELVRAAWERNERNQVRTAKHLNLSRNILRTFLKKAGAID